MKRMIDPPNGWKFGFPKEIPETVNDENIVEWFLEQGYPQTLIDRGMLDHCRMWMEDIPDEDSKEEKKLDFVFSI